MEHVLLLSIILPGQNLPSFDGLTLARTSNEPSPLKRNDLRPALWLDSARAIDRFGHRCDNTTPVVTTGGLMKVR